MSEEYPKKVKVSIFVPLKACGCAYSHFMDQVMKILMPYRSKIEFEVKDAESKEAEALQIFQMSVVLENYPDSNAPIVVPMLSRLEDYLARI